MFLYIVDIFNVFIHVGFLLVVETFLQVSFNIFLLKQKRNTTLNLQNLSLANRLFLLLYLQEN
uniref:Uncharacterized protein n=1 Tax=Anguilla anguilla TaxID=7936 RepID=A0A0E9SJL2_ANGAN